MKLKKIVALSAIIATLTTSVLPMSALAAESKQPQIISVEQKFNTQAEWDKLEKYVKVNSTTLQFELEPSAQKKLSSAELKFLKTYMQNTNKTISEIKKDRNASISIKNNNTLSVSTRSNSRISLNSIDTDSYWDYDIHVWGYRIFLSKSFVNDMSSKVGNTTTYFAGGGTAMAMTQLLEELGVSSGPAGWIGLAAGGGVVYAYDKIVSRCSSTGVYIDINLGCSYFSGIYGA